MNNKQKFKLIDGNFSALESREILGNVLSSKIQFHQIKNFTSQERFGIDDEASFKRMHELKESMADIMLFIKTAQKEGKQLEIKSDIEITIV